MSLKRKKEHLGGASEHPDSEPLLPVTMDELCGTKAASGKRWRWFGRRKEERRYLLQEDDEEEELAPAGIYACLTGKGVRKEF